LLRIWMPTSAGHRTLRVSHDGQTACLGDVARLLRRTDGASGQAGVTQSRTVMTPATLYPLLL
jgi:hypothetical protein